MSPRTRLLPLAAGLLLLSACGAPPEELPASPPLPRAGGSLPAGSVPAGGLPPPSIYSPPPVATPSYPYPTSTYTYPTPPTVRPTTTPPTTTTGPTPSYAPRCSGEPTAAQIVTLAESSPAVPDENVSVLDGPYCASGWSFATVGMTGAEPLFVVATGTGATLTLVTVGTDVCNPTVKTRAPAGIRAMACGS
ncbi:hypothetical protein Aph02nite_67690 [Actinoplanes philippinensis]|uniref:Uncharacterized protein n=1 Tax=Actinoplanes philippinensis TaxID=35752 RepID=A0A1I2LPE6_9ACTN|nr:hypothetical protein [Actinoplanes philippinensis]GIE80819.1 hypothetical protein Aph02nite_67690 [Actinoplanes philippinensis]SFF78906.1 hypothetical protein SAMN05421541_12226 [Actinoplanes philippinensis]